MGAFYSKMDVMMKKELKDEQRDNAKRFEEVLERTINMYNNLENIREIAPKLF
jgi:hypothetical protein